MNDTPGEKRRRGAGRAAFLARIEPIKAAVERGLPLTIIYDEHGTGMGLSYSQFHRYVARYVRNDDKPTRNTTPALPGFEQGPKEPPAVGPAPEQPAGGRTPSTPPKPAPGGPGQRFRHNAEPDDKDSLI